MAALTHAASRTLPPTLKPMAESLVTGLLAPLRGVAFWGAILLPVTYLPMLFAETGPSEPALLLALIVLNVLAFVVGHGHKQPDDSRRV